MRDVIGDIIRSEHLGSALNGRNRVAPLDLMIPVITIRRARESPRDFGRVRAVRLAPGLHPAPLFVTITDGKLMS
jgi:hypothetical protein